MTTETPGERPQNAGTAEPGEHLASGEVEKVDGSAEAEEPLPSFSEQLADQLGGVRGVIESGVPVLVFVVANIIWSLRPAIVIAVASAVIIGGWRLARRQPVRHAVNGIFGIAIGAIIAWRTGSAKDFYLPGILLSLGYGLIMLASVAVRRPIVGWVWSLLVTRGRTDWRDDPRMVRTFSWLTVVWALTYLAKVLIQALVFQHTADDSPATTLGILRLALGYPPYLLLIAITVWATRRASPEIAQEPIVQQS
ncbi:DUF3159 domain-containing protein [Rugosimonospora africana]|uniref:Membrane protein n=1 Tax=Rugosimonospora africana TaxID=556532 RepID=A0A8J3QMN0_9ACTN|nr:DUF3159 domain-containing protein [Rugosimonospora africana]GIH13788.1 membrane protein [Rugosimonospora africana]